MFQVYYKGLDGLNKKYRSRKYMTKKEAQEAKRQFLLSLNQNINHKDMTFKDLYLSFYDYQSDKVKEDTIKTYRDKVKYFQYFINIKLKDFNINHFKL
ncbi:MAG TPA: Arm DNA-binding domain-containing protein [Candidatus Faecimonas intestinavium]|nr:Arm DNA-binding domain-containing protein [Candidatus Faecimonas intestinavium]